MNTNELSNEIRRSIWERQNGMCAFTGKKFEDFNDLIEADFVFINPVSDDNSTTNESQIDSENVVMLWKRHDGIPKDKLKKYLFPYANFVNYNLEQKADELKDEIDKVVAMSATTTNWNNIINQIRDVTNCLQSSGIPIAQRRDLKKILLTTLNDVEQKQREESEKNRVIWQTNYDTVRPKLLEAIEFAKNATFFKEAREKLIEVQNELRNLKISRDNRSELEKMLRESLAELNTKQQEHSENFEMECIENYYTIKTMLDEAILKAFSVETFPDARDLLVEVQNEIKDKSLKKEQRNEFFEAIRNTFDELRNKFEEYKLVTDEEAAANYAEIKPKIDAAVEFANNATDEQASDVRDKLLESQKIIKDTRLQRKQKDELFAAIREVFDKTMKMLIAERKRFDAESNENFNTILSKIEVVIVDVENAIDLQGSGDALSAIRAEIQLSNLRKKQQIKLFDKLRVASNLLAKQWKEYRRRRFAERVGNLEDICKKFEQKNERINNFLVKDRDIFRRQQEKLATISEDNIQAKNNILQIIEVVNKRIVEREASIAETAHKITNIKNDIEKITKQEEENAKHSGKRSKNNASTDTVEEHIHAENSVENPQ